MKHFSKTPLKLVLEPRGAAALAGVISKTFLQGSRRVVAILYRNCRYLLRINAHQKISERIEDGAVFLRCVNSRQFSIFLFDDNKAELGRRQ